MSSFTQSYFFFHFYVFLYTDPIHFHAYFSQFSWKELLGQQQQQQQHERHEWMFSTAQSSPEWFIYILGWTVLTRCSGHGRLRECMDNDCWSWWMMTVHALCLLKDMPSYVRTPCNQLWLCHQTPFQSSECWSRPVPAGSPVMLPTDSHWPHSYSKGDHPQIWTQCKRFPN